MKPDKKQYRLYAVTDRLGLSYELFLQHIEEALQGGVTLLQLREKHLSAVDFLQEAKQVKALCRRYGVPLIINDDVQTALLCGADGVHIGQEDMSIAQARGLLGENAVIGVSAHNLPEALTAWRQGADYLGVGAAFGSHTKSDAHPIALQTIADICASVPIPVVAIGGIQQRNVRQLAGTGISGVAVVSALFGAPSVTRACQEFQLLLDGVVQE